MMATFLEECRHQAAIDGLVFGDKDPIGLRIGRRPTSGAPELDYEIIGVVGDAKYQNGRVAPYAMYYLPFLQQSETARRVNQQAGVELDRSHYAQAIELHVSHAAATLETDVRRALADELLFGKLQNGGKVTIDLAEGEKIVLKFEEEAAPVA